MPMCKFGNTVKITKIFLYIVYIDKLEQLFYNILKEFRSGLCRKEYKLSDYEKMELCRKLARRILNISRQVLDTSVNSSSNSVSTLENQDTQKAEEAHSLRD